jgi:hypothetical protein
MLAYTGALRTHRTNPTCCPLGSDQHRRRHCQAWTTRVTALPRHKSRVPIRGFLPAQVQQRSRTSGAPGLRNSRRSSRSSRKTYLATVFIIAPSSLPLTTDLPPYRLTALARAPIHQLHQLCIHRVGLLRRSGAYGLGGAVLQVMVHQLPPRAPERFLH